MHRLFLALVWITAAAVVAAVGFTLYQMRGPAPRRAPDAGDGKPIVVEMRSPRQPFNPAARWTVTEQLSAHHVLTAHVETEHVHEARAIAQQLTEPIKSKYAEVLIYFHRPGRPDTLPPRRVQWTPSQGYVETVYDER